MMLPATVKHPELVTTASNTNVRIGILTLYPNGSARHRHITRQAERGHQSPDQRQPRQAEVAVELVGAIGLRSDELPRARDTLKSLVRELLA